jgi:hypothetical protein
MQLPPSPMLTLTLTLPLTPSLMAETRRNTSLLWMPLRVQAGKGTNDLPKQTLGCTGAQGQAGCRWPR